MDALRILFLFLPLLGFALQADEADGLAWQSGSQLRWEDFRGVPPEDKTVAATTASGISYTFKTKGMPGEYTLDYEVIAFFYPEKSWYHAELSNPVVLMHEQLHFDITELYARRMRKMLSESTFSKNVRSDVRQIFSKINRELKAFQDRYDLETDFSRNPTAQQRWNEKIAAKLKESNP